MHVREIMSQPVVTCPEDSTLDQVARLMWEFDCGIVPVVRDDGRLAGVVTDRDICMAAYTQGRPLSAIPVTGSMARQVIASHVDDGIESVEQLMGDNQVRRVPVLDGEGRPVGLISMNDLVRLAARRGNSGDDHDLVHALAAICQPRSRSVIASTELPVRRAALAG
jgi:CBS domain-containing protein